MDWSVSGVDLNLCATKNRSSKSAPVTATEEIGTQTYDKAKGPFDQGIDKRWPSTSADTEFVFPVIGPPQEGTISVKDGILLVQVSVFLLYCEQTCTITGGLRAY